MLLSKLKESSKKCLEAFSTLCSIQIHLNFLSSQQQDAIALCSVEEIVRKRRYQASTFLSNGLREKDREGKRESKRNHWLTNNQPQLIPKEVMLTVLEGTKLIISKVS